MWISIYQIFSYTAIAATTAGFIFILFLFYFQDRLVFVPDVMRYPHLNPRGTKDPKEAGLDYEDLTLTTDDGVKIHCWFIKQPPDVIKNSHTFIYFQSQSANIGLRIPLATAFHNICKVNILLVSYRGFGYSEGKPSERGLYMDGQAALKYIKTRTDINQNKIFVFGSSLGTSVAVEMAYRNPTDLAGIILENPFIDLFSVAKFLFPILKFFKFLKFLFNFEMNNLNKISKFDIPLLIITSKLDTIVPTHHSKMLIEKSPSKNKKQIFVNSGHNEVWVEGGSHLVTDIFKFLLTTN